MSGTALVYSTPLFAHNNTLTRSLLSVCGHPCTVAGPSQQKVSSDKSLHTIPSRATSKMVPLILYFLVGTCSAFSWPAERLRVEKVGSFARREVDGPEPVPHSIQLKDSFEPKNSTPRFERRWSPSCMTTPYAPPPLITKVDVTIITRMMIIHRTLSPTKPSLSCHQNFTPHVARLHFLRH